MTEKTGTLRDATNIASASKDNGEAQWVKHRGKPAVHGFKAHDDKRNGTIELFAELDVFTGEVFEQRRLRFHQNMKRSSEIDDERPQSPDQIQDNQSCGYRGWSRTSSTPGSVIETSQEAIWRKVGSD